MYWWEPERVSSKFWNKRGCLLSSLLLITVLEVLAPLISQGKEIKIILVGKEETKLALVAENMLVCKGNRKESMESRLSYSTGGTQFSQGFAAIDSGTGAKGTAQVW